MNCSCCGKALKPNSRFCNGCGTPIAVVSAIQSTPVAPSAMPDKRVCAHCGKMLKPNSHFCNGCGTPVAAAPITRPVSAAPRPGAFSATFKREPPVQKRKMNIWALACVAGVVLFFVIGNVVTDPLYLAKTYASAVYKQRYSSIYPLLDVRNEGLTSRDVFEKMLSKSTNNISVGNIVNYEIIESSRPGSSNEQELSKNYTIQYVVQDSGATRTQRITFVRHKDNILLFFPKWKIAADSFIARNYSIIVPSGAEVMIDNVRLGSKYLSTDKTRAYYDTHVIPDIFIGEYEVQVSLPFAETNKRNIRASNNNSVTIDDFKLRDSSVVELTRKLADNNQKIYSAAMSGMPFQAISSLFLSEASIQQNAEQQYKSFRENINRTGNRVLRTAFLASTESSSRQASIQRGIINVTAALKVDYAKENSNWLNNNVNIVENSTQSTVRVQFVYQNGQWYQTGWSIIRL